MGKKIKEIDNYIAKAADFAKPILTHIRDVVHKACPEAEESLKWGMPFFGYKGEMMCNMASFKAHATFGFWKAKLMKDPVLMENARSETSMGHMGRLTSLKDLPSDRKLTAWIKEAMALNDKGIKVARPKPTEKEKKTLVIPDYFTKAIKKNKKAATTFDAFSYSHKKEYVEWVTEAKTDETRNKRIETAIEWMSEGKNRMWKYQKK